MAIHNKRQLPTYLNLIYVTELQYAPQHAPRPIPSSPPTMLHPIPTSARQLLPFHPLNSTPVTIQILPHSALVSSIQSQTSPTPTLINPTAKCGSHRIAPKTHHVQASNSSHPIVTDRSCINQITSDKSKFNEDFAFLYYLLEGPGPGPGPGDVVVSTHHLSRPACVGSPYNLAYLFDGDITRCFLDC